MKKKARKTHRPKLRKATDRHDIVELMLRDHKPLKRLIKTLKNPDRDFAKLRAAFEEFAPLLDAHAKPEQESLYQHMQRSGEEELRVEGFEGLTEHTIVDELAKKIKSLGDEDEWKAHVKVLAELVEHHI